MSSTSFIGPIAGKSFTPTGAWTTNVTYTGQYRIFGNLATICYKAAFTGATDSGAFTLNMPSGLTVDESCFQVNSPAGYSWQTNGTNIALGQPAYNGAASNQFFVWTGAALNACAVLSNTNPFTIANGHSINVTVIVPIL